MDCTAAAGVSSRVSKGVLKVSARTGQPETRILGWDAERQVLRIDVAARPESNKANLALVKYLSKLLSKKVRIKTGLRSREKLVEVS